jgi:hypothetical protein
MSVQVTQSEVLSAALLSGIRLALLLLLVVMTKKVPVPLVQSHPSLLNPTPASVLQDLVLPFPFPKSLL